MLSFACISEHINGIKGNLFTMKEILALFCPSAPLTTPLWLLCAAEGVALGCCWAQGQPKACWPMVALLPWLCWHTQLCSPAGGTTEPEIRSPTCWKVPEPAPAQQCSSFWTPWTPPADELLLSLHQFLEQQRDRQTCKPLPKDSPNLFFQAEAKSKCFKVSSQPEVGTSKHSKIHLQGCFT